MATIFTTEGRVAYTDENCPGFTVHNPADKEQLETRCKEMNTKAAELGITTRYEVKD
jgi:hypothetical protein